MTMVTNATRHAFQKVCRLSASPWKGDQDSPAVPVRPRRPLSAGPAPARGPGTGQGCESSSGDKTALMPTPYFHEMCWEATRLGVRRSELSLQHETGKGFTCYRAAERTCAGRACWEGCPGVAFPGWSRWGFLTESSREMRLPSKRTLRLPGPTHLCCFLAPSQ